MNENMVKWAAKIYRIKVNYVIHLSEQLCWYIYVDLLRFSVSIQKLFLFHDRKLNGKDTKLCRKAFLRPMMLQKGYVGLIATFPFTFIEDFMTFSRGSGEIGHTRRVNDQGPRGPVSFPCVVWILPFASSGYQSGIESKSYIIPSFIQYYTLQMDYLK